jgi:NADP-dependent 3-hydroxy acid dehydrogenase YdfG
MSIITMSQIGKSSAISGFFNMAIALITGGNSGIGKATALLFAQRGYKVAIAARRPDSLAVAKQEIEPYGSTLAIVVDIADAVMVNQMVEQVVAEWGEINVLIHAAGRCFQVRF